MTEEEENFQSINTFWIFEKPIDDDDEKVEIIVTGKIRGSAHFSCYISVFHDLRSYDSHLIFCEL